MDAEEPEGAGGRRRMITIPVATVWLVIGWALGVTTFMAVAVWAVQRGKRG